MSRSEIRRRTQLVGVRLDPNEYRDVERAANAAGITVAEMLRRSFTRAEMAAAPDLHRRLIDLFATEFVVHRAGAKDPNVAAAGRVLDVIKECAREHYREAEGDG